MSNTYHIFYICSKVLFYELGQKMNATTPANIIKIDAIM